MLIRKNIHIVFLTISGQIQDSVTVIELFQSVEGHKTQDKNYPVYSIGQGCVQDPSNYKALFSC